MAMEGHYESHPEGWAPLYLFGLPNDEAQRLDYAFGIPGLYIPALAAVPVIWTILILITRG